MIRVRLLHQVGNDPEGAVLEVREDRAHRLVRGGYAEELPKRKRAKETVSAPARSDDRRHDGTD